MGEVLGMGATGMVVTVPGALEIAPAVMMALDAAEAALPGHTRPRCLRVGVVHQ